MAFGKREQRIITVSKVAVLGNVLLSVLKIVFGIIAGSLAVVADGIDSASDVLTSLITLFAAHIISRPPNLKYPYGYSRADTLSAKILAFIIFFAGAQLAIFSMSKLLHPEPREIPKTISLVVVVISIVTKQLLALYLKKTGKEEKSNMLIANAKNMQSDVVISASVLVGLIFTFILKIPILDVVTALFVSLWIMVVAIKIFFETTRELMDGVDDPEIYDKIINACRKVDDVSNPHRIRVRKMAHLYLIALDIEVPGNITLDEAHTKSRVVEHKIKKQIPNVYDIIIHVEPIENDEPDEVFGISEKELL